MAIRVIPLKELPKALACGGMVNRAVEALRFYSKSVHQRQTKASDCGLLVCLNRRPGKLRDELGQLQCTRKRHALGN